MPRSKRLSRRQKNMLHSAVIAARLREASIPFKSNDAIGEHLTLADLVLLEAEVRSAMRQVMSALVIDVENDPNSIGTAERVAKMFMREVFAGRYDAPPRVVDFPNGKALDELYTLGRIAVRSACSHHLCPVQGHLWVGVIPSERVIGISKFSRIARWVMARPTIQEEAVVQLADHIEALIKPRGLAIVIKAEHSCLQWRGVQEHDTTMVTSVLRGIIKESPQARDEFFKTIAGQGFSCQ